MIMNAIRSYEAEYNIQSFFRDLPEIRAKTFTVRTIKHSFQNAGIWPVSFTAVKKKLMEYGKKKTKENNLEILEYGSESESADEGRTLETDLQLNEEYQLPQLLPLLSYYDCVNAL
jgi:hypothetical protein